MSGLAPYILVAFGVAVVVGTSVFAVSAYREHRTEMAKLEATYRELDRRLAEGWGALAALSALAATGDEGTEMECNKAKLEIYRARLEIYKARLHDEA